MTDTMLTPVNTKSFLAFIFGTMERLDSGKIDVNTACAQAKLMSQANNVLNYELKRADIQMKLAMCGSTIKLREIESKGFDDTVNK